LGTKLAAKVVELSEQWNRDRAAREEEKKDSKDRDRMESTDDVDGLLSLRMSPSEKPLYLGRFVPIVVEYKYLNQWESQNLE
jgi:hypothetical protein